MALWKPSRRLFVAGAGLIAMPAVIRAQSPQVKAVVLNYKPPIPVATGYTPQGVHFDFVAPTEISTSSLTGIASSKVGTLCFWFRATGNDAAGMLPFYMRAGGTQPMNVFRFPTGSGPVGFRIDHQNAAGTLISRYLSGSGALVANGWQQWAFSWDLNAGTQQVFTNGVSNFFTSSTLTNDTIGYAGMTSLTIPEPGSPIDADLADMWFDPTTAIDFTVTANIRKFIDGSGNAVNLGSSGQLPTGTAPILFLKGPTTSFLTNLGTGGNFSLVSGALTAAGSNPP